LTTPIGEGYTSLNVRLRKTFNLYAAVRPIRSLAGTAEFADALCRAIG